MSQIEVTTLFHWNGKEYPFDIRDADDAEKFENASADMTKEAATLEKTGKVSNMIRAQCKLMRDFFVTCFDEQTATEILGEKDNLDKHYAAYTAFCGMVSEQRDYFVRVRNTFSQFSNRQQRRHPNNGQQGGKNNKPKHK